MPYKLKSSARRARRNRRIGIIVGIVILALIVIGLAYVFTKPAPQYELFVGVGGSGSTNVTGTNLYPAGTQVAIKATANSDWVLNDWLLNGASIGAKNPTVLTTTSSNQNLTAVFTQVPTSDKVLLETSMGNITIQLRDDKPNTSGNFKKLIQEGKYDGTTFHRVIADFMIQGGQLNESVASIPDEIGSNNSNVRGTIAMGELPNQPDSASSSFFINVADNGNRTPTFDSTYTVFGYVIQGMDVVDAISKVPVGVNEVGENSKPLTDVVLIKAIILP